MTHTTMTSAQAWSPDEYTFAPEDVIPTALINQITTPMGSVEGDEPVVRVAIVLDDEANIVPEGAEIPEADPDLAEALIGTVKVGKLLRVSREQFTQPGTSGTLSDAAQRSIITKADQTLLRQPAPVAPEVYPPGGLLATVGLPDGGTVTGLDGLIGLQSDVQVEGANPTHWVMAPDAWAAIQRWKRGEGSNEPLLGAGATATQRLLLSTPVLVTNAMPPGEALLLDRTDIGSVIGPVRVAQSEHVYFSADSMGMRVTFRFGARMLHPERHTRFTVAV